MNGHLSKAFNALNKCLFDSKLKPVDFVLNPSEKYVLHLRFPSVIEIGGGFSEVEPNDVLDELLHVMIHLDNRRKRITDFTHNQYHKREFCDKALELGLIVVWHKTRGWGLTFSDSKAAFVLKSAKVRFPTPEAIARRQECYTSITWPAADFQRFQMKIRRDMTDKPHKIFQLKYICECDPPVIIRSGRRPGSPHPLDITCNICKAKFVMEPQTKEG